MFKKTLILVITIIFLANIYGCVALIAGAAGGGGTAAWLSGKLVQEVDASSDRCLQAIQAALRSLNLIAAKQIQKNDVIQVVGKYNDGRKYWIDVHRMSRNISKISVRVGAASDKEAARVILNKVLDYL